MINVKKILNTSESYIYSELIDVSLNQDLNIFPQQTISNIIDSSKIKLTKKENMTFKNSTFDFIITDNFNLPLFAIEFDGPDHERESKVLSDLRKMSICKKANLPILRIDYKIYDKFSKDSIIQYLVNRYVSWNQKKEEYEINYSDTINYLRSKGKDDEYIRDYMSVEEPEMNFNFDNYFPKIDSIRKELALEYDIYPDYLECLIEDDFNSKYYPLSPYNSIIKNGIATGLSSYQLESEYILNNERIELKMKFKSEPIEIRWIYAYNLMILNDKHDPGIDKDENFFNGIPGTNIYDLSFMLSEYECIFKLKKEIEKISKLGGKFVNKNRDEVLDYYTSLIT